jgi:predicted NACHT family NTPase
MLTKIFKRGGGFPATKWELYEKGTRLLAEELNESRLAANKRGRLSPDQRLAIAGRIAAATILCNRYAVWKLPDVGDVPPEDVQVAELTGRTETAGGNSFEITPLDLEEVLDTGLFSSRGLGRMGWSHQTSAEFLAARYVLQHDLATLQILGFLRHAGEVNGSIVPQLEEVTAWIAMRRTEIFDAILPSDPAILLRSDIATGDEQSRDKVVVAVLDSFENRRAYDIWSDLRSYRKLANLKLTDRLLPYIRNPAVNVVSRRAAMLIAESCGVKELGEYLLGIALDSNDDEDIRAMAVSALSSCGSDELIQRLRSLVAEEDTGDSQDEIKGSALKLLWPRHLTAAELFEALKPKKRPELHGSYSSFLASRVTEALQQGHGGRTGLADEARSWANVGEQAAARAIVRGL